MVQESVFENVNWLYVIILGSLLIVCCISMVYTCYRFRHSPAVVTVADTLRRMSVDLVRKMTSPKKQERDDPENNGESMRELNLELTRDGITLENGRARFATLKHSK